MPSTPIIGRDAERRRAEDLLWDNDVRLVTICGPGGVGKTRLALATAWGLEAGPGFVDGIRIVDLAPLRHPDLVAGTIARAVGLAADGPEFTFAELGDRDLLLVLDNFEHVLPAAEVVATLLASTRRTSVLVTSRRPLRLHGEHRLDLAPLDPSSAAQLFVERARAVGRDIELDRSTAADVDAVCALVDRLPLAIELAAARVRVLTTTELCRRLTDDLGLLSGGPVDQPDRLRSVRSAIAWSDEALDDDARSLLRQLAVFAGGWTLEAAETVCRTSGTSIVDGLSTLLEHHLVARAVIGPESRFTMLETVRRYAAEQRADVDDGLARRHATAFLELLRDAAPHFDGADQVTWLDRVERDHDNVRAALAWAMEHDPVVGLELAGLTRRFWALRGYIAEGLAWLDRSLELAPADPTAVRVEALLGAGTMHEAVGDDAAAEARYRRALDAAELIGDQGRVATACRYVGNALIGTARYDEAEGWYERARSVSTAIDDRVGQAAAASGAGNVAYYRGAFDEAEGHWSAAASLFRTTGMDAYLASMLNNLAEVASARNDAALAVALHEETVALRRRLGDRLGLAQSIVNLGGARRAAGDLEQARVLLEEALDTLRRLGAQRDVGSCLLNLALVARDDGRPTEAAALARDSIVVKHQTAEPFEVAQGLELLAAIAADRGWSDRAAGLIGAASAIRERVGARSFADEPDAATTLDGVRRALGPDMAAAVADGAGWTTERMLALAAELAAGTAAPSGEPSGEGPDAARRLGLTARELEVLGYLVRRYTDREIAEALIISLRTVTTHVSRIFTKLGVNGRRQAAAAAVRLELVAS